MTNSTKFLGIDIHFKLVAIILFLVILLAIWLLITTPDNYTKRSNFYDISKDIATEYTKLADSLTSLNVVKIKYNLTH